VGRLKPYTAAHSAPVLCAPQLPLGEGGAITSRRSHAGGDPLATARGVEVEVATGRKARFGPVRGNSGSTGSRSQQHLPQRLPHSMMSAHHQPPGSTLLKFFA
jgi:hypothetical protein